jgi:hypothetical protein
MSLTSPVAVYRERPAFGGLIGPIAGVATIALAICGLVGVYPPFLAEAATIVFGAALMIQGGTMRCETAQIAPPKGLETLPIDEFGGAGPSIVFLTGAVGIVLGVLALLGLDSGVLTPIASVAFGVALVLSGNAAWRLCLLKHALGDRQGGSPLGPSQVLAMEMASSTAVIQAFVGLAAVVLGVLALSGNRNDLDLNLVALLALGGALILSGGVLSALVLSLIRPWQRV